MSDKIFFFLANGYDGFKLSGQITESEVASKLEELKNTPNVLRIMIWEAGSDPDDKPAEDWVYSMNSSPSQFYWRWSRVS